jgi:hypothetical protein
VKEESIWKTQAQRDNIEMNLENGLCFGNGIVFVEVGDYYFLVKVCAAWRLVKLQLKAPPTPTKNV